MSASVIHLPADVLRFRQAMAAVRERAGHLGATPARRRHALQTVLTEMLAGRSSGAAVALANSSLRDYPASGWAGGAA